MISYNDVISAMKNFKLEIESLSAELTITRQDMAVLKSENDILKTDIFNTITFSEHQANRIAGLEMELDNMGQFNRRNNVVFTNIELSPDVSPQTQVIKLCDEIGMNISQSSFSSCHVQPCKTSDEKQIIARFKETEIAGKILKIEIGLIKLVLQQNPG